MIRASLFTLLILVFCSYYPVDYREVVGYSPILMEREELDNSIKFTGPRELEEPGKIYVYGDYVFINDRYRGFHVFDNQNPADPVNLGFVKVPGSLDIAVKEGVLYVDNATDLVAIDYNDMQNPVVTERLTNVFPETYPPGYTWMPSQFAESNRPVNTVIIGWIKTE